jgi:WD40 repeat protein
MKTSLELGVWDLQKNAQVFSCSPKPVRALAWSPTGGHVAVVYPNWVEVWDVRDWKALCELSHPPGELQLAAFSPDGNRLASMDGAGVVRLWDWRDKKELLSFEGGGNDLAFSGDGQRLASAGRLEVRVWELGQGRRELTLNGRQCVAISADGQLLATGSQDDTVKLWDGQTGKELLTLKGHEGTVRRLAFLDNHRLASAAEDGTVRLWDVSSKK